MNTMKAIAAAGVLALALGSSACGTATGAAVGAAAGAIYDITK